MDTTAMASRVPHKYLVALRTCLQRIVYRLLGRHFRGKPAFKLARHRELYQDDEVWPWHIARSGEGTRAPTRSRMTLRAFPDARPPPKGARVAHAM